MWLQAYRQRGWVLFGFYGLCLILAAAGYERLSLQNLSPGADLAVEAASAAVLLFATLVLIGGLRRHLVTGPFSTCGAALLAAAAGLAIAVPILADSYATLSSALEAEIEAQADLPQTVIELGPNGRDVRLTGALQEGAATRLADLLTSHPEVTRIHLTSEGGLADEGQALGDVIAQFHLVTYVPDYCVSACTLAFVRGTERTLMRGARLGFHAPYDAGLFGETFQADGETQRLAYIAAGVAPEFVTAALKVASSDLWVPDPDRLIAAHVVTAVVDAYRFPDSNLDGQNTPKGARETILRNFPKLTALADKTPDAFEPIVTWYLGAYAAGQSEGAVHEGLEQRAGVLLQPDKPFAPPALTASVLPTR